MSKGKRWTVADWKAALVREESETTLYRRALSDVIAGKAPVVSRGKCYTVRLMRPAGPQGGQVAITFHPGGQEHATDVRPADDWSRWAEAYGLSYPDDETREINRHGAAVRSACYIAQKADGWHVTEPNSPAVSE